MYCTRLLKYPLYQFYLLSLVIIFQLCIEYDFSVYIFKNLKYLTLQRKR